MSYTAPVDRISFSLKHEAGFDRLYEAIPELEVLANEVSAAHGAASAPINPEQMHYLMSRGLSKEEATSMMVEGFLIDSFTGLDSTLVRETIHHRLTSHLEQRLME